MSDITTIHEQAAASAFSKQAPIFDLQYNNNTIIRYKRKRVREKTQAATTALTKKRASIFFIRNQMVVVVNPDNPGE
jgi:hypothetical protein